MTKQNIRTFAQPDEMTRPEVIAEIERVSGEKWEYRRFQGLVDTGKAPPCVKRGRSTYSKRDDVAAWTAKNCLPNRWEWLTRKEIAPVLHVTAETLNAMASFKTGPSYRVIGKYAYYHVASALRWRAEHEEKRKPRET
jgi:hypothetical protein